MPFNYLISNFIKESEKLYICSPSLHQDQYHKKFKCFIYFIRINITPNVMNEEVFDLGNDDIVNGKEFEK